MLLGSSRPYPWFILEENGRWTDDDDDDDDDKVTFFKKQNEPSKIHMAAIAQAIFPWGVFAGHYLL